MCYYRDDSDDGTAQGWLMAEELEDPHETDVFAARRSPEYRFIRFETLQGIARITLDRPPANVLAIEMMEDVALALEGLEYQRDVKLVVLAGAGKYFSAGFELDDHLGDRGYVMLESFRRIFELLFKLDKPTLAVVAGPALGAGSILAMACDIVLAAASAKFAYHEIKAGVFNPVTAVLLPRLIGRKRALEIVLAGASLGASEAAELGLVSRAIPDDRLDAEVEAVLARFRDLSAPVLQSARRAVVGALDLPFAEAMRHAEDVYLNQLMATEDATEGLRAVGAKRKPIWRDR
jgi:cyclohexa-1,5-dienecarbonyl-CoA hydratase